MLIVAGHAIWNGSDWDGIEKKRFPDPAAMKETISQHIECGCEMVVINPARNNKTVHHAA
jgi:hypothetical protein